jgi:hypothetical protein
MNPADIVTDIGVLLLAVVGTLYLGTHVADWAIDRKWHW